MKIILGLLLAPIAVFFHNGLGFKTYVTTQAALATVNGGGMDYQVARSIATMPDLSGPFMVASLALICWGMIMDMLRRHTPTIF